MWQRLAAAVICVVLMVGLWECKPKPGGSCRSNGKIRCEDPTTALLCRNSVIVAIPCRGQQGCKGPAGGDGVCDDDLAQEGDPCQDTLNENFACSTDHAKELLCKDGKFVVASTCKGPKKCSVVMSALSTTIHCDDSMADLGDPCRPEPGDANYACSTDKKVEVQCDAATSKFVAASGCRGPRGCFIEGDSVQCDSTYAREGDPCRHVDRVACSEDAKSELKCSPQMKWISRRPCKRDGCRVKGSDLFCG
jgi:hypothetical protein